MSKDMFDQAAVASDRFPYDPAAPFRHMGRAILHGTGSRDWNLFLATLPPRERKDAVKSAKAATVYNKPSCYWPPAKTHPRGTTVGAAKGG